MIVSVSGYNYSGSSAVVDLLMEYGETMCIAPEIGFSYLPDGIVDLAHHINSSGTYFNGDVAIDRYYNLCKKSDVPRQYKKEFLKLTKEYIDLLVTTSWNGNSYFDGTRKRNVSYLVWKIQRLTGAFLFHFFRRVLPFGKRRMVLVYNCDKFAEYTNWYYEKFEGIFSSDKKVVIFNQFFSAFQPERSMEYAKNGKTIIVDRDPRDIYILGKVRKECSCYPVDDVHKFVLWYKKCHSDSTLASDDRILRIQFEDLIFKYDETSKKIEKFLGISNHISPKKKFNPEISKNNTQLVKRFPELKQDIEYIEKTLASSLYSFNENYAITGDFF